jgi:hypothetical protein
MKPTLKSLLITSVLTLPVLMGANDLTVDEKGDGETSPAEHHTQAIREISRTTEADPNLAETMRICAEIRQAISTQAGGTPSQSVLPIHSIPHFIAR